MRMRGVRREQAIREEATKAETMKNSAYWLNLIACSGQPGTPAHTPPKPQRELTPPTPPQLGGRLSCLCHPPPSAKDHLDQLGDEVMGEGRRKLIKRERGGSKRRESSGAYKRLAQGLLDGLLALVTPPATKVLSASASINICLRLSRVLTFFVPWLQFFIIL